MYIKTVTFEVLPDAKERFSKKIEKDLASLKETPACLFSECWVQETKKELSFTLVTKWTEKKDFQGWLKRPEHVQEHRDIHKARKEGEATPSAVIKKTANEYSLFA